MTPGHDACWLARFSEHPCDGPMDRCHLVPKQRIKRKFATAPGEALHRAVWHPFVWVWGCRRHHGDFDARMLRVRRAELPSQVERWAEVMDMLWSLERDFGLPNHICPPQGSCGTCSHESFEEEW